MPDAKRKRAKPKVGHRPRARPRRRAGTVLVANIGNSATVFGVMEGREAKRVWRLTSGPMTADEATLRAESLLDSAGWKRGTVAGTVVCSVVPSLTAAWVAALERVGATPPLEVGVESAPSMPVRYRDRGTLGPDRIANAVAARDLYGTPAIVVDLGTATTFDCVSRQGAFLGGVIAAGVMTSADELARRASRIPRVELRRPARAVGRSTEEALQVGAVWGAAGMVDALVRRLALEMKGTPHVIATGGLAGLIAPDCETINRVDETLTLKGMVLIWEEHGK
jgi:type III pantothenate kinase